MRVTILGTGAMACLFAARLEPVAEVTLCGTWEGAIRAIRRRGVCLEEADGIIHARVRAAGIREQIAPADLVVVLVKAWQTPQAAARLPLLLKPGGFALTLQNGLGNLEILGPRTCLGVTTAGATLLEPGRVRSAGDGPTHIAGPEAIVGLFRRAGLEVVQAGPGEVDGLLWGKLVVNCGINALTALLGVPNGGLLERPHAAALMDCAAEECARVARGCGVALPFEDPALQARRVAERTASNLSSMLQDMRRGAPTECDAINGAVVLQGGRLGIATPVNEALWRLVKEATLSQPALPFPRNRHADRCQPPGPQKDS